MFISSQFVSETIEVNIREKKSLRTPEKNELLGLSVRCTR